MRKITSHEIRELKSIIRKQNQEIINLNAQIYELEHQLEESRAKEGKGCLERVEELIALADADADEITIEIESIGDVVSNICDAISEMPPDEED